MPAKLKLEEAPTFAKQGYTVIKLVQPSAEIINSFDNLPRDTHSMGRLRQIRLTQYFSYNDDGEWVFATLPKRDYIQSSEYIKLAEAGGVRRHREQLEIDPSNIVSEIMNSLPISKDKLYQVNVNQIRVISNGTYNGITVPEGPHRDGHEFSVIAVVTRKNIEGGKTQIFSPDAEKLLFEHTLSENQAILIDDERFVHTASNIKHVIGSEGYRDIFVIEVNHWNNRAYGLKHEKSAESPMQAKIV